MAHHQHHGADYDAQVSRSLQSRPRGSSMSQMPIISEDDLLAEPEEPPDYYHHQAFTKTVPYLSRKESLLTRGLSTDTESHDEQPMPEAYFGHLPSVSSTTSNFSGRSNGDFTSDDGHHSPSTRASTPSSPRSVTNLPKILIDSKNRSQRHNSPTRHDSDDSPKSPHSSGDATPEPTVEAQLGRKRCITFACGGAKAATAAKAASPPKNSDTAAPAKRPCALKFVCPFTASKLAKRDLQRTSRHLSPAPVAVKTASPRGLHRRHRDSDTTIKYESPKAAKPEVTQVKSKRTRRASNSSDLDGSEAYRFNEFANSDGADEEWTRESTCHMSRLTVTDTLKKENEIRQLAEEADEEDLLEEEEAAEYDDDDEGDSDDGELSDQVSEGGFQTDDEEGFAESDDDEAESDSDYEWWAPRKSRAASPFIGSDVFRPVVQRDLSGSSSEDEIKPTRRHRGRQRTKDFGGREVPVRPGTPELPDSTDFVCGTLDEDRPLEQAYISCLKEREAAKHRTVPQDIDPSFPTSDPEIENDDEEDAAELVDESDQYFVHGRLDNVEQSDVAARGRRLSPPPALRSPRPSPKRMRSPPPPAAKKAPLPRSPAPCALFNRSSPRRFRSPAPTKKLTSPPPSPKGSGNRGTLAIGIPFLAQKNEYLTHTASLPRSPHPFRGRRMPNGNGYARCMEMAEDDDGEATEHAKPYARGAIDIAQGLERKRLKRREKFYRQYLKKEEKKKSRRPQPGHGAQRMRQVGLECATLRGTRMLSI